VKWSATEVVLCGNGVKIQLVWLVLLKDQQQAVKERVQELLLPHFDLLPRPDARPWMVLVAGILGLVAIVVVPLVGN